MPLTELDAFAQQVISPALSTIDGVAQVLIFGSQKYAVRIQIDPTALAARGIGVDELQAAIAAANANTPVGTLQNDQQQLTITAETQLANAAAVRQPHHRHAQRPAGAARRCRRGHRFGREPRRPRSWYDGTRAIVLAVQRQPDANTVEVVDRVKAMLPTFAGPVAGARPRSSCSTTARPRSAQAVDDVQFTLRAHHRAGDHGDLPVPAPGHGDHHPGRGRADLADRHARRRCICSASPSTTSRCWG